VNLVQSLILTFCALTTFGLEWDWPLHAKEQRDDPIRYQAEIDLPWLTLGLAGSATLILLEDQLAPSHCRWCEPPALDEKIRNEIRWANPERAHRLSSFTTYALIPASSLGLSYFSFKSRMQERHFPWIDAMLILEAAGTAEVLAKSIQFVSGRQRPSARFGDPQDLKPEDNTSFFSGHTSVAFAMAVTAGTYADMTNSSLRTWTWGAGLSLAVMTAYLRVASDHHYFSDVMMGALMGSLVGASVPRLRARFQAPFQRDADLRLTPLPSGLAAQLKW
jgi:membrane-associated phospholipid phosphatase